MIQILKHELVLDAITNYRPIGKLFKSEAGKLLDDYVVRDYVSTDNIPEIKLNGRPAKLPASDFFKKHRYLTAFEEDKILQRCDSGFAHKYRAQKRFHYEYKVHFFDTFMVAEILPSSLQTEFVLVAPPTQSEFDRIEALKSSNKITALFLAISQDTGGQLALYVKLDQLLEYLHTGLGKKKRFGLF